MARFSIRAAMSLTTKAFTTPLRATVRVAERTSKAINRSLNNALNITRNPSDDLAERQAQTLNDLAKARQRLQSANNVQSGISGQLSEANKQLDDLLEKDARLRDSRLNSIAGGRFTEASSLENEIRGLQPQLNQARNSVFNIRQQFKEVEQAAKDTRSEISKLSSQQVSIELDIRERALRRIIGEIEETRELDINVDDSAISKIRQLRRNTELLNEDLAKALSVDVVTTQARAEVQRLRGAIDQNLRAIDTLNRQARLDRLATGFRLVGRVANATFRTILSSGRRVLRLTTNLTRGTFRLVASYETLALSIGAAFAGARILKLAGDFELVQSRVESFIGTTTAASKVLEDLVELAKDTSLNEEELLQSAPLLLSAGVAASELEAFSKVLGNIAAATDNSLLDLSRVFLRNSKNTKLLTKDIREFTDRAIDVRSEIIRLNDGLTLENLDDEIQAGNISVDQLKAALISLGSVRYGDALDRQAQTFLGRFEALISEISIGLRLIGEPILSPLRNAFEFVTSRLESSREALREVGFEAAALVQQLGNFFQPLSNLLLGNNGSGLVNFLKSVVQQVSILFNLFRNTFEGDVFANVGNLIVGALETGANIFVKVFRDGIRPTLIAGASAIGTAIKNSILGGSQSIGDAFSEAFNEATVSRERQQESLDNAANAITDQRIERFDRTGGSLLQERINNAQEVLDGVNQAIQDGLTIDQTIFQNLTGGSTLEEARNNAQQSLEEAQKALGDAYRRIEQEVRKELASSFNGISGLTGATLEDTREQLVKILQRDLNIANDQANSILDSIASSFNGDTIRVNDNLELDAAPSVVSDRLLEPYEKAAEQGRLFLEQRAKEAEQVQQNLAQQNRDKLEQEINRNLNSVDSALSNELPSREVFDKIRKSSEDLLTKIDENINITRDRLNNPRLSSIQRSVAQADLEFLESRRDFLFAQRDRLSAIDPQIGAGELTPEQREAALDMADEVGRFFREQNQREINDARNRVQQLNEQARSINPQAFITDALRIGANDALSRSLSAPLQTAQDKLLAEAKKQNEELKNAVANLKQLKELQEDRNKQRLEIKVVKAN